MSRFANKIKQFVYISVFFLIAGGAIIIPNSKVEAQAEIKKFIYIDMENYTLQVLEGDVNNPAKAKPIYDTIPVAGPREYFKSDDGTGECLYPPFRDKAKTRRCTNFRDNLPQKYTERIYYVNRRDLPTDKEGNKYSYPLDSYKNQICNPKENLIMTNPLQLRDSGYINIHSYNPCFGFDPIHIDAEKNQALINNGRAKEVPGYVYDNWGKLFPKGHYTHGCWAVRLDHSKYLFNLAYSLNYDMPALFGDRPYNIAKSLDGNDNNVTPVLSKSNTRTSKVSQKTKDNTPLATSSQKTTQKIGKSGNILERCNTDDIKKYMKTHREIKRYVDFKIGNEDVNEFIEIKNQIPSAKKYSKSKVKTDIVSVNDLRPDYVKNPQLWTGWTICVPEYNS